MIDFQYLNHMPYDLYIPPCNRKMQGNLSFGFLKIIQQRQQRGEILKHGWCFATNPFLQIDEE